MKTGGPLLGAASGLALAAVVIACLSLAGGGAYLHVDLAGTGSRASSAQGGQTQGAGAVSPQTSPQTTETSSASVAGQPVSSLGGVGSEGRASLGLMLLPVLLGAVLGVVVYGAFARRIDSE